MALGDVAARMPWPVFACDSEKRPVVATGYKAATRDAGQIMQQFAKTAAVMIGVPTGEVSGICVIDVDIKNGARGQEWLDENVEALPPTRTHKTRSGGLHLVFRMPEGIDIRNSAGRVAPGVDVRGNGGYVIVPPSPSYSVADATEPAEMPRWLIRACMREAPAAPAQRPQERHEKYVQAAIDGEVLAVMRAGEGKRNDKLNVAAVKLGTLVAAGQMSRAAAEAELTRAAQMAGLDPREIAATIKSGLDFGVTQPRQMPEKVHVGKPQSSANSDRYTAPKEGDQVHAPSPLVWFDDIRPCLDALDFVQGVLIEGTAGVVYGESNAGKTFWTTDLALHVAAGMEWNGRAVDQGGVVYCVLEGGNGFANRVSAWRDAKRVTGIPFASRPYSLNLLNPDVDVQGLIDLIHDAAAQIAMPVKLIVVDTLARAFAGGNENASEDMGALVQNLDRIRRETGACVLFVHHSGKDQAKGARGHSSLRAAIDTEIEVVAGATEEKTATIVKQRDLKKGDVFGFKLDVAVLGRDRRGNDVTTCLVVPVETAQPAQRAGKRKKLTETGQNGMRALHIALDKGGDYLPELPEYPHRTFATSVKAWRDEFYQLLGGRERKRTYFERAEAELVAAEIITQRNGHVWLVKQGNESQ